MYTFFKKLKKNYLTATCLKRLLLYFIYFFLSFLVSYWSFWATTEVPKLSKVTALFFTISLLSSVSFFFWAIVVPCILLIGIYSPVSHLYGPPDFQKLMALLGTQINETIEFLKLIPVKFYFIFIIILLFLFLIYIVRKKLNFNLFHNKFFIICFVLFSIILSKPINFFSQINKAIKDYIDLHHFEVSTSWRSSFTKENNKDFLLIIGESARKDYFNIYNYPVKNTPFLNKFSSIVVNGLFSGGTHTAESLSNMLTDGKNWKPRFDRNFIDLAKSANIETIWISNNQPTLIGIHNTAITAISMHADKIIRIDSNSNDLDLLDPLFNEVEAKAKLSRLFVLHTQGSHPDACERVKGMLNKYEVLEDNLKYIACYVSSIRLTDELIKKVYEMLKKHEIQTGRPFSILYFSDHGMKTYMEGKKPLLIHGDNLQIGYEVPLLKIDSEVGVQRHFKTRKSGLRFTQGLANWMSITNPQIDKYDLFDGIDDQADFGQDKPIYSNSGDLPIDIAPYLKSKSAD